MIKGHAQQEAEKKIFEWIVHNSDCRMLHSILKDFKRSKDSSELGKQLPGHPWDRKESGMPI